MIVYTFFLCFCLISPLLAQDGYKQWLAVQGSSLHLQENCRIKTIYASIDGDSTRLNKQQVQFFVQQRVERGGVQRDEPIRDGRAGGLPGL